MPVRLHWRVAGVLGVSTLLACGGGGGGSSPTGPTPTPAPIPSGVAGTTDSQSGCAATYICPNVDAGGNAGPATPTFDRLTLNNGTSSTCQARIGPNVPPPDLRVEFTIRNPDAAYRWTSEGNSGARLGEPTSGSAATAGPHQAAVRFLGPQGTESGQVVTQTLTLQLRRASGNEPLVASCAVTMWGFMAPAR